MKTRINRKVKIDTYPMLKESIHSGIIVLFENSYRGTVLKGNDNPWPTGTIGQSFSPSDFKPFEGEITLYND